MERAVGRGRFGFTMIEVTAALAIAGILAAITAPPLTAFLEAGRQSNRMSAARTIYLAAQNQLTEMKVMKRLGAYGETDGGGNLHSMLGDSNWGDAGQNKDYVRYISKPAGVCDPSDPVIRLLDPIIIDKAVFDGAILIEYNVKTGEVMSAFYSDALQDADELRYSPASGDAYWNVYGPRAYDENAASRRRQGYFGVGETGGDIPDKADEPKLLAFLYDGCTYPLPDERALSGSDVNRNVLYAEIFIPKSVDLALAKFNLSLGGLREYGDVSIETGKTGSCMPVYFDGAITLPRMADGGGKLHMYEYPDVSDDYTVIIWVIDYAGGDTVSGANITIGGGFASDAPVSVRIEANGIAPAVSNAQNPYYLDNAHSIKSARHLWNIRYAASSGVLFTQQSDIDLAAYGGISNFKPIEPHGGVVVKYDGGGHSINNLRIDYTGGPAGLFGTLGGAVSNLTLDNPSVAGGENTGSVCGVLEAGGVIDGVYIRYEAGGGEITGSGNVGGITGTCAGTIENITFISPNTYPHITGGEGGGKGGIAGAVGDGGILRSIQYLALAPESGGSIYPIAGNQIPPVLETDGVYYLSGGVPIRPSPAELEEKTGTAGYNTAENTNGVGTARSTPEMMDAPFAGVWGRIGKILTAAEALDPENGIYPYKIHRAARHHGHDEWPIADGKEDETADGEAFVLYYEMYSGGTYGGYTAGIAADSLKSGETVAEAGFILVRDRALADGDLILTGGHVIGYDSLIDGALISALFDNNKELLTYRLSLADMEACYRNGAQTDPSAPIVITCGDDEFYIHPLFAKGVYQEYQPDAPISEFAVRTPWQMRNIGRLTGAVNYSSGKIFTQELDLDFKHEGVGVNRAGDTDAGDVTNGVIYGPVVGGEFRGVFDGNGLRQSGAVIGSGGGIS
ncbi:MAG: prepilin-type N-terminal cleavage/methylation domain-containing protein, partial [Oscillospiraceae bacterium]|nr:prepilin-type N-terminal cleavage/methylation domain-containing protein [Oscillospiraceae bacterium]